jgi:hypothetical protein
MYFIEKHPFNPFSCLICTLLWLKEKTLYHILKKMFLSMHNIGTLCTLIIPKWDVSMLETALWHKNLCYLRSHIRSQKSQPYMFLVHWLWAQPLKQRQGGDSINNLFINHYPIYVVLSTKIHRNFPPPFKTPLFIITICSLMYHCLPYFACPPTFFKGTYATKMWKRRCHVVFTHSILFSENANQIHTSL